MACKSASFYIKEENLAYINAQIEGKSRYNKSNWLDDLVDHLRAKSKPVKKAKTVIELPEGLNVEAWDLWMEFRKRIKKPLKTNSQAKNLINLGRTMQGQMDVVQQSINNEYQGLFEVKGHEANQQGVTLSVADRVARANGLPTDAEQRQASQTFMGSDDRALPNSMDEGGRGNAIDYLGAGTDEPF